MSSTSERLAQEDEILRSIRSALNAYDTISNPMQEVVYASSPITSGKRMYEIFRAHGASSIEDLKQIDPNLYYEQIMSANIGDGIKFGQDLVSRGFAQVIVPGKFFQEGWSQEHYMSLWEQVIDRFAEQIHFNNYWQYSNGCAQEFLFGMHHNLPLFSRDGIQMNPGEEAGKIRLAIDEIDKVGVNPITLYNTYRRIELAIAPARIISFGGN